MVAESMGDPVKRGWAGRSTRPDRTLDGEVFSVAPVTRPAGWWTGNVVKYDTIIKLPSAQGLKPGMSAEVDVVLDLYEDVLTSLTSPEMVTMPSASSAMSCVANPSSTPGGLLPVAGATVGRLPLAPDTETTDP